MPTPKPGSSSGGTTGGGETGGGGTTGGTVTANEKQFIIHLQDIKTANSTPFANKKYHIQSGDNSFDVDSDANSDILLDISPKERSRPNTVIGDTPTISPKLKFLMATKSFPAVQKSISMLSMMGTIIISIPYRITEITIHLLST